MAPTNTDLRAGLLRVQVSIIIPQLEASIFALSVLSSPEKERV